jgi:hypothetical protein
MGCRLVEKHVSRRRRIGMSEIDMNQQVADEICTLSARNGKQFRKGDCVALLDGEVVAVAPDLHVALRRLRAIDPSPDRGMVFEVGPQVVDVIR